MKRVLKIVAWVAVIAVVLTLIQLKRGQWPFEKDEAQQQRPHRSYDVGPEGGTFQFMDGVEVTIPRGAVTQKSTLTVTSPTRPPSSDVTPFKELHPKVVKFDVSISQSGKRDIQPRQPLLLTLPLSGSWVPSGAKPQDAKVYTPFQGHPTVVPSMIKSGMLSMSLGHLSPKYVTYVSDANLVASFDGGKADKDPSSCNQQVSVPGGKVTFGNAVGWSASDKNSPVYACLSNGQDGYVRVGVLNRVDYIVSVAATSDVHIAASEGDFDTEAVKLVTKNIFPNKKIKALIGGDDTVVGSVRVDDLPATIEVRGDPNTFFAASIYRLLSLAISYAVDIRKVDQLGTINKLLGQGELLTCLQSIVDDIGEKPSVGGIIQGAMKCASPLVEALTKVFGLKNLFWKKVEWVVSAITAIGDTAVDAWNGIRLTVNNTIQIPVVAKMDIPSCPSSQTVVAAWESNMPTATRKDLERSGYDHSEVYDSSFNRCVSPWIISTILEIGRDGKPIISTSVLLHFENGQWDLVEFGEQLGAPDTIMCTNQVPRALRPEPWTLRDGSTC